MKKLNQYYSHGILTSTINVFGLIVCIIIGINFSTYSQHHNHSQINGDIRLAAIDQMVKELKNILPDETHESLSFEKIRQENGIKYSIRLFEKGFLRLSGTDWIYFLSSSAHNNPDVGDITLAIDSKGKIFENSGHVCGGIIHFETVKIGVPATSNDFFEFYESDTDGVKWKKLDHKE